MTVDADLVVAGGGPVGLAAAILARRHGLDVIVVEPRTSPIDKACGEGLMPSAVRRLSALGLDPPGRPLVGIRYIAGSEHAEARFRAGAGRGVRRTVLQESLAGAAASAGVHTVAGRVGGVVQDGAGVLAAGVRARWLLAADGLHSDVRRSLDLDIPTRQQGRPARFGQRRHYALRPWTDYVEVHWSDRAEAYVTPVSDSLVGVAVLGPAGLTFAESLDGFPALRERLGVADPVTPVRGAGPLRRRARAVRAGRVLLVGDAAGYVDALTGEGISVGIASAEAAVTALVTGDPASYERAWRRLSWRYRSFTSALVAVTARTAPRGALVPAARRLPRTFAAAVDFIG